MNRTNGLGAPFVELKSDRVVNPPVVRPRQQLSHPFQEPRWGDHGVRGRELAGDCPPRLEGKDDAGPSTSPRPADTVADARTSVDYSVLAWIVAAAAPDRRAAGMGAGPGASIQSRSWP